MKQGKCRTTTLSIRVKPEDKERLDGLAHALGGELGIEMTRPQAFGVAIREALERRQRSSGEAAARLERVSMLLSYLAARPDENFVFYEDESGRRRKLSLGFWLEPKIRDPESCACQEPELTLLDWLALAGKVSAQPGEWEKVRGFAMRPKLA